MTLKKVSKINWSEQEIFDTYYDIVKNKKHGRSILFGEKAESNGVFEHSDLFKKIENKYNIFFQNKQSLNQLEKDDEYTEQEKAHLLKCYSIATKGLNTIKKSIKDNQNTFYRSKCTYCGIGEISSMDHFVPKNNYPEYAVHPYNLVLCCATCNSKKGELFKEDGQLIFFNPYFDEEIKSLKLDFKYNKEKKVFDIEIELIDETYKKHIMRLDIINRYKNAAGDILDDLLDDLLQEHKEYRQEEIDDEIFFLFFKKNLQKKMRKYRIKRGENSIKFLVYEAFSLIDTQEIYDLIG